ncbi:hypothetical protein LTR53_013563 [Teratosphaeriaceae sp. CCFEE 6253]|nr:hypothetical protein LTR53_013563 [Teratosphaeriaceae sp. CCFEE 6253]
MNSSLPAGWRVSNSSGSFSAPTAPPEDSDSDEGENVPGLTEEDLRPDSPGWEDVEEDVEKTSIKCLICDEKFDGVRKMVEHAKGHDLDFDSIRKRHNLDFIATVQLVNFVRRSVLDGASAGDLGGEKPEVFQQDEYLQPVLDDDALLYSIDELAGPNDPDDPLAKEVEQDAGGGAGEGSGHKEAARRALQ